MLFRECFSDELQGCIYDLSWDVSRIRRVHKIEDESVAAPGNQILGVVSRGTSTGIPESLSVERLFARVHKTPAGFVLNLVVVALITYMETGADLYHRTDSASFCAFLTRTSPDISFGSRASRIAVPVPRLRRSLASRAFILQSHGKASLQFSKQPLHPHIRYEHVLR